MDTCLASAAGPLRGFRRRGWVSIRSHSHPGASVWNCAHRWTLSIASGMSAFAMPSQHTAHLVGTASSLSSTARGASAKIGVEVGALFSKLGVGTKTDWAGVINELATRVDA